jgi:hypothetical protein
MIIEPGHPNRRTFFEAAIAAAVFADAATGAGESLTRPKETRKGDMLYRSFGKTGETVSVITSSQDVATRIIRTAIDNRINFMDNSWEPPLRRSIDRRVGKEASFGAGEPGYCFRDSVVS